MGTRAQVDVRQGKKVVRVYSQFDGSPRNILPVLRTVASAGFSTPYRIAQAIVREFGGDDNDDTVRIIDEHEDRSDEVSYHYVVDASSRPWRVRQTQAETVDLPTKPDGSIDDSPEAFERAKTLPAVTRSFRIGLVPHRA